MLSALTQRIVLYLHFQAFITFQYNTALITVASGNFSCVKTPSDVGLDERKPDFVAWEQLRH